MAVAGDWDGFSPAFPALGARAGAQAAPLLVGDSERLCPGPGVRWRFVCEVENREQGWAVADLLKQRPGYWNFDYSREELDEPQRSGQAVTQGILPIPCNAPPRPRLFMADGQELRQEGES